MNREMHQAPLHLWVVGILSEIMGTGGAVFSAVIFVIGVLLLVYARRMSARGVLA